MDNGTAPYITNISAPALTAGLTKTYDLVATLKTATTAANLSTGYRINITSAGFESMNGVVISGTIVNPAATPVIEFVKTKPTVSYVSSSKGGTATYVFRVAANGGDLKLSSLSIDISNNTNSTGGVTATLWLGNQGSTQLGT